MKTYIKRIFIVAIIFFATQFDGFCQGPPPDPSCPEPPCAPIPIDGGISFLIAAGVAYGSKKIYDSKVK